ncbi:MAG TPA: tetratricopeptide repeat protein [Thermoanaerobaculia bacterium]|nr:tetratricopeptide repeat protein [Thermoanaerobaculia bacterium]
MKRALLLLLLALPALAQSRLASDFEIAQMEKQLAQSKDFESQLSGRLNLGDVRAARNEMTLARNEYRTALELAQRERLDARRDSSLSRYANATSYAALAQAKLGREAEAFALLEESARYSSDDAENWNLYASAMRTLRKPRKAVAAARNAVAIAKDPLDVAVYRHALATSLIEAGDTHEAEQLLVTVTTSLRSKDFERLQREAARTEAFEVYSSARGDVAAYVSLLNRAQLRLASLYEKRGDTANARVQYERVLEGRSDDVTALAALGRYDEAFAANPFSMALVRQYQRHLQTHPERGGAGVQLALQQLARGETRAARETLDALLAKHPDNETLRTLRREAEGATNVTLPSPTPAASELRALIGAFERLTSEQRTTLDRATYTSVVRFEGGVFEAGTIDGVPFRFGAPVQFHGTFDITAPLRLTYRILGVTRSGESDALLLEPVQLEAVR